MVISRKELKSALGILKLVACAKGNLASLGNILMQVRARTLVLTATNLKIFVQVQMQVTSETEGTELLIDIEDLIKLASLKGLPDKASVEVLPECKAKVVIGGIEMHIGTISTDLFPPVPETPVTDMLCSSNRMKEMIEKTIKSMTPDVTRVHYNCARLECGHDNQFNMVTTDGHRISTFGVASARYHIKHEISLPPIMLKLISKLRGMLAMSIADSKIYIETEDRTRVWCKCTEEPFPSWERAIPRNSSDRVQVRVNKEMFENAVRVTALTADERSEGIKLQIKKGVMHISSDTKTSNCTAEVPAIYAGKEFSIGFKAKYLLDVFGVLDEDEVMLEMNPEDNLDPLVIREKDFLHILMPMRL